MLMTVPMHETMPKTPKPIAKLKFFASRLWSAAGLSSGMDELFASRDSLLILGLDSAVDKTDGSLLASPKDELGVVFGTKATNPSARSHSVESHTTAYLSRS